MKRLIYRAQWLEGQDEQGLQSLLSDKDAAVQRHVDGGGIMTIAAYKWQHHVFLYYECIREVIQPEELFPSAEPFLEDWPGKAEKRKWMPMIDVFHFNEPVSYEHWLRKEPVERRAGRVAHLKPEMISSYIYYHYQLQEERAFLGDKYEIIALHDNLMFGYQEFPKVIEEPLAPKKLQTKGTPENWNDSRMDLHFQAWEDGHLYFKHIDPIFTLYCGDR
ncbi:hypothetical protein [Paenibacillus rigui]|uniref:Uncharacterized protein n=1 Tax=Paenibacillus rigui TaxID=554312 RepID=A0A229UUF3_9BACL|nr:hypothetical protein [Paenibacillus rigui]OXM87146.1 hypothetical protein CF651_05690 [Paenibacillus rigui]